MAAELMLPISMAFGIAAWTLIARWYVLPALNRRPESEALTLLILPHCFRYIGLAFLITGVTAEPLDPRFAIPAAWGDLLAATLAFAAIAALRKGWSAAPATVWTFNLLGAADLANAVTQGLRFTDDGHLGATYFIPAIIVPALLVSHALIAVVQMRRWRERTS
jgi:hypothetical protein